MNEHGFSFTKITDEKKEGSKTLFKEQRKSRIALIPLVTLLISLLLSEPPSMLFMAAGAIILHELGHVLVLLALTHNIPALAPERFGLRLLPSRPLLPGEELAAALGGPLLNVLFGVFFCRLGGDFFFTFGAMHFLFAFFNLLPYESSDGGRVFHLLFLRFLPRKNAEWASILLSGAVLSFFYFVSLYVFYFTGDGLSGVFFSIFSFPWRHLDSSKHF